MYEKVKKRDEKRFINWIKIGTKKKKKTLYKIWPENVPHHFVANLCSFIHFSTEKKNIHLPILYREK